MSQVQNHTVISWTRFCEWVQGKKPVEELDMKHWTVLRFEDGTEAIVGSSSERRFGETTMEPPLVSIKERAP